MFHSTDHRPGQPLLKPHDPDSDSDTPSSRGRNSSRANRRGNKSPLHSSNHDPDGADSSPYDPRAPPLSRRPSGLSITNTMRSRGSTPASSKELLHLEARRKYTIAAFFLVTSLVSFTVQTELAAYIQHDLGWDKAYCMLYLTHGSWTFLWPLQLLFLRIQKRHMPWPQFWRRHVWLVRTTAEMVQRQEIVKHHVRTNPSSRRGIASQLGPSPGVYLVKTTVLVTLALTVAGLSWYLAVSMTTPSDLTAIYNCSAFFAYAFSVLLLKERLRLDKSLAVLVAIIGVLVVAYGDGGSKSAPQEGQLDGATRLAGNLIIGMGSVLYGLYEVLYKRYACPPEGVSAGRGVIFANTFGSLIGTFTLTVLWIPLPLLHWLGWETFEIPTGETAWLLFISVVMNMIFSGSFLVLISLTSPVLSSVAALLTIFIVAIADWFWFGTPISGAGVMGGLLIILAFGMLSWSTWREMQEDESRKVLAGDEPDLLSGSDDAEGNGLDD
ncbi:putative DUF6 domain protein [Rhypophila decipiens]